MKISILNLYSMSTKTYRGEAAEVQAQLRQAYPWLARSGGESVLDDVAHIARQQAFTVEVD